MEILHEPKDRASYYAQRADEAIESGDVSAVQQALTEIDVASMRIRLMRPDERDLIVSAGFKCTHWLEEHGYSHDEEKI